MPHRFQRLCVVILVLLIPAVANACPYCAGREGGIGTLLLMAAMIALPFGVAGVVYKVIKKVNAREESELLDTKQALGESQ